MDLKPPDDEGVFQESLAVVPIMETFTFLGSDGAERIRCPPEIPGVPNPSSFSGVTVKVYVRPGDKSVMEQDKISAVRPADTSQDLPPGWARATYRLVVPPPADEGLHLTTAEFPVVLTPTTLGDAGYVTARVVTGSEKDPWPSEFSSRIDID
jgi:hypothetical protein